MNEFQKQIDEDIIQKVNATLADNDKVLEKKLDSNGRISYKRTKTFQEWFEYDERGNEIYSKFISYTFPDEIEVEECKYDSEDRVIYRRYSDSTDQGDEEWMEYDEKGRLVNRKDNAGNEYVSEYDDNGELIKTITTWTRQ